MHAHTCTRTTHTGAHVYTHMYIPYTQMHMHVHTCTHHADMYTCTPIAYTCIPHIHRYTCMHTTKSKIKSVKSKVPFLKRLGSCHSEAHRFYPLLIMVTICVGAANCPVTHSLFKTRGPPLPFPLLRGEVFLRHSE